jgi:O-antigen ligase
LPKRDGQAIFCGMVWTRNNLDWWCERGILILLLGMLVFAPLALGAVQETPILVLLGMASMAFGLWGIRLWLKTKTKILWPPLTLMVVAFMVYALARYLTADIEYVARMELIQVLLMGFIFMLVVNNLRGQDETETISFTLIGLATLISGYAMTQLLTRSDRVWNVHTGTILRASGTYISGNHLAGLLEQILPLALAFLLVGRMKVMPRIVLGYAVLMMCGGLAVTFSRGGWVAGGAGILLVLGILLGHRNHRWRALVLLVALLSGGWFFVSDYLSKTEGYIHRVKIAEAGKPGVIDTDSRLWMWGAAERMWEDHKLWGVGPAHFNYRFREYRPETLQLQPDRCHNDYLNLLADWGVVGAAIVLIGMVIFVAGLFKTWPHVRREENDFGRGQSNRFAFFLGATGGLFAMAVHSTVDFNLHIPANALVAVILLALLSSNLRFATERHWWRAGSAVKLGLSLALALVVVFFMTQEVRLGSEAYWQAHAERQANFSPERGASLARAFAAEPKNFQTTYDIGECYRTESLDGGDNYKELAQSAMGWFARGMRLNPHDGYNYLRMGMCLDWVGKPAQAEPYFRDAEERDPNGYYLVANIGWHYVQTGDYAAARQYFERSRNLMGDVNNVTALNYLRICQSKLVEKASGQPQLPLLY